MVTYWLTWLYVLCLIWQKYWKRAAVVVALLALTFMISADEMEALDNRSLAVLFACYVIWVAAMAVCLPTRSNKLIGWAFYFPFFSGAVGFAALILFWVVDVLTTLTL